MNNIFNSKFIRFIVLLILNCSCVTVFPQRFKKHDVCLPDKGILTATVRILPPYTFSIKEDNQSKWVEYEISDQYVIISALVNTTRNSRKCVFVLLDGEGNPVDTLKLTQMGKTTTASKVASSSTIRSKSATSAKKSSSSYSSSGGQCAARTKKGTRCSRKASAGSIYCWQHNK